jgi:hypothetical protein
MKAILIFALLILALWLFTKSSNVATFKEPYPKIDVVYTWVDGNDPAWQKQKEIYTGKPKGDSIYRYNSTDELKYSLRSLYKHAPWINKIYIVVADLQKPRFVNENHPKIKIIQHSDIIPIRYLPTFNSIAIETCIHHIPGLEEHFLYFNDDCFLGNDITPEDIFNKCYYREYEFSQLTPNDGEWICNMKNDYLLLKEKFPETKYIVPWHQAHFCKKSLMYELEYMFPENYEHSISQKLRKQTNEAACKTICLPNMQYNLGVVKGIYEFLPDKHSYGVEMGDSDPTEAKKKLKHMKEKRFKFFCVNNNIHNEILRDFLEDYFPFVGEYENK